MLMETSRKDVRSIAGNNYRHIMLLVGKTSIEEVNKEDAKNIEYFPMNESNSWKIDAIKELVEVKNRALEIDNFIIDELEEILTYLCTS